jgi:hypothetical protein
MGSTVLTLLDQVQNIDNLLLEYAWLLDVISIALFAYLYLHDIASFYLVIKLYIGFIILRFLFSTMTKININIEGSETFKYFQLSGRVGFFVIVLSQYAFNYKTVFMILFALLNSMCRYSFTTDSISTYIITLYYMNIVTPYFK